MYPSSDSEFEEEDTSTITDILSRLHKKWPALNYPQYETALHEKGIAYVVNAIDFGPDFYKEKVGMADGAVGPFVKLVGTQAQRDSKAAVRRAKKGKKRARVQGPVVDGEENMVSPSSNT